MKNFTVYRKRDGQSWIEDNTVYANNYNEAKIEFANQIWNEHNNGCYGDDTIHFDAESIKETEGETSWYEEPGFYDMNMGPELVFADRELENGIESFSQDVNTWTIDKDRAK